MRPSSEGSQQDRAPPWPLACSPCLLARSVVRYPKRAELRLKQRGTGTELAPPSARYFTKPAPANAAPLPHARDGTAGVAESVRSWPRTDFFFDLEPGCASSASTNADDPYCELFATSQALRIGSNLLLR